TSAFPAAQPPPAQPSVQPSARPPAQPTARPPGQSTPQPPAQPTIQPPPTCPNENHNCTGITPCCGPSGFCGGESIDCGAGCYQQFSDTGACLPFIMSATFEIISDTKHVKNL
ncbi:20901_t:CDS:2, partial [Dentiscutata erythropus]